MRIGYPYRQLDVNPKMPAATAPLYMRIQEMLRTQIASGRFAAGAQLPSAISEFITETMPEP